MPYMYFFFHFALFFQMREILIQFFIHTQQNHSAFYDNQRAKIRADVRDQQAKREAAAATAAKPRVEVKCSGRPFVTTEVATDMFGSTYYKQYTAYPFQVSYGGVKHDFVVVGLMPIMSCEFLHDAWVCVFMRGRENE